MRWPDNLKPQGIEWALVSNDRMHTSPLSNSQQVIEMPGSYWECTFRFTGMTRDVERELSSLLGRMRGRAGTVDVPVWGRFRGGSLGAPVVVSAPVYAYQIDIGGITPNVSAFSAGDYITIGGEMFEVVEPASSSAAGRAVVEVNKRVRATIAPGTPVEYRLPFCRMRRSSQRHSVSTNPGASSATISMREAF